ncbi:hypothetical protein RJD11_12285 [Bacillus velezensis]|uniref:hypothetical protein n=1 Tax=Bacillus TaxID=1386 RepID=UPI001C52D0D5|nr:MULTISPECIES: hypothetical protein [Bacillus amyloliquefaciens group]MBV2197420.1 hypothetical protein [Bacillus velezensis]QXP95491.1 hypothetical protein KVY05_11875 [Bacillus velezensis]QXP99289.1 hypothetical protein KVY05_21225 [Bacillus velezensis]UHH01371.1 hypothetical protein LUA14_12210 [Bacillus amyloliquefaciens]ULR21118.1 hypothetical protein MJE83_12205 [Bacillus velezensis]
MSIRKILADILRPTDNKEKICRVDDGLFLNLAIAEHEVDFVKNKIDAYIRYLVAKEVENPISDAGEKYNAEFNKALEKLRVAWNDIHKSAGLSDKEIEDYNYSVSSFGNLYRYKPTEAGEDPATTKGCCG